MRRTQFALFALLLAALFCCRMQAQSTQPFSAQLTAACTNATTTCDGTAGSQLKFGVGEYSVASVTAKQFNGQTWSGSTLFFEFSDDGGTSWYPTSCTRNDSAIQELSEAIPDNTNRSWDCGVSAARMYRIRQSAISSGGPLVTATLSSIQIEPAPTVSLALPNTQFALVSNPAAGTQASAVQAAAGTNLKNVATMACFSAAASTAVAAATLVTVNLRDGASGAGTVKATWQLEIPASAGQLVVPFCANLNFVGSANTAMTLEFSAGVGNLVESVTLHGYTSP